MVTKLISDLIEELVQEELSYRCRQSVEDVGLCDCQLQM